MNTIKKRTLLEAYADRLKVADGVYAKAHNGEKMNKFKKITTARCLANIEKFMNEAFNNSTGTQRTDLGAHKKFTMDLVNVAVPNLIAFDLVMVQPMASSTGNVVYIEYVAGSNKGQTKQGDLFASPFGYGTPDVNYTARTVNETHKATTEEVTSHTFKLKWIPVAEVVALKIGSTSYNIINEGTPVAGTSVLVNTDGTITFADSDGNFVADAIVDILYNYDNEYIPQNDIPTLTAHLKSVALVAKARRIQIYYSNMAAYQMKQDYGVDLGEQLAEKAIGQLSYEIDTEVTQLLIDNAPNDNDLVWSRTLPTGVSMSDHYESFSEVIEIAKAKIYDRTKKFAPNYMLISSDILRILSFNKLFTPSGVTEYNGPFFAGTLGNLKVYVTPNIKPGHFVIGVNGNDMMSSAAIYAPYMPIVPTQLLGFADGSMNQGFSTLYALQMLNPALVVAGRVTA